jgi:YidC/Oxa1 family membrane protein insertase
MMDIQRFVLYAIFISSAFFLWSAWQQEHAPPAPAVSKPAPAGVPGEAGSVPVPQATTAAPPVGSVPPPGSLPPPPSTAGAVASPKVTITTDLYTAEVDTVGGVLSLVSLAKHQDATDPTKPYRVLQRNADRVFIAQAGLIGAGWPNHETRWEVVPGSRELAAGSDRVELRLQTTAGDGSKVVQILTFHRASYVVDVAFDITNTTGQPIAPEAYFQITRDTKQAVVQSSMAPAAFVGPVVHTENKKFEKVDFGEVDKLDADKQRRPKYETAADNGWVGMIEHYFVAAWIPPQDRPVQRRFYTTKAPGGLYTAGVRFSEGMIAPGATGELRAALYVGPQDQDVLARTARGLELVVDYGVFTVLAVPLFIFLKWLHGIIGNWGSSIVVMTIVIKGAFYPLNAAAARSMAKMKIIAPKMKALQEQYANDKQQLQIKMMEMYKTEKINPLGGCLPILVQIPVFIALYWVLLSAVELRQAPWILWIHDLSAPDPYFVLPVIYAITAYLQVKLSPTPITDPVQARVMQIMPIAFSVLFIFFPSGLVLYWLVNNILQILQQWHMNRLLEREAAAKAAKRR